MGKRDLVGVLAHLYSLEINCGLSSFWDAGWRVWIGDEINGLHWEAEVETLEDAARWLRNGAAECIRRWRRDRRAIVIRGAMRAIA